MTAEKIDTRIERAGLLMDKSVYYDEAIGWYENMYLFCMTERASLFCCIVILGASVLIAVLGLRSEYGRIEEDLPIVRNIDFNEDSFISIKKLLVQHKHSAQIAVSKYLIMLYLEYMYSYRYYPVSAQMDHIKKYSSYSIFRKFQSSMSVSDSNSPIAKLGDLGTINVKFISVDFPGKAYNPSKAVVIMDKSVVLKGNEIEHKKVRIVLDFVLSDIKLVLDKTISFSFVVNNVEMSEV